MFKLNAACTLILKLHGFKPSQYDPSLSLMANLKLLDLDRKGLIEH